jgi:CHAT domain-containing protein
MHFATHGNLDYQDFSQSYLTMAENPSKNEDGQLTLEELLSLDLMKHFNLVVLSACKTAVADKDTESSPVSPASSFLQQGVRAVVASLWAVNDVSTSYFSTTFYENLKNNMELAEALRQAQVRTSQQKGYAHPFFWSPFILLGNWR